MEGDGLASAACSLAAIMSNLVYVAAAVACLLLVSTLRRKDRRLRFPGPTRYPIIGTPFRPGKAWLQFTELSKQHGAFARTSMQCMLPIRRLSGRPYILVANLEYRNPRDQ